MADIPINPTKILGTSRQGWTKSVTGLNKKVVTGYSILGQFLRDGVDLYTPGGLYLHHDPRRNPAYILFRFDNETAITIIAEAHGRDWATDLWPKIEATLPHSIVSAAVAIVARANRLAEFSTAELERELARRRELEGR